MDTKFAIESIVGGVVITAITGLYNNMTGLIGATPYGFPATWIRWLAVGPQYSPWQVDPVGLVIDLVVWIVVVAIILAVIKKYRK
ncbi:MAG TPA: hypothetical protein VNF06_03440 [Candidatus Aquilonibacter sp.]|nr:hypothetical protein [Candidatus Aquilonibacter sp.]